MLESDSAERSQGLTRRDAAKAIGLAAASACLASKFARQALALAPAAGEEPTLIPVDKKLPAAWIKSLTERGSPEVYRGDDLRLIGMPVGGITSGQLYLGGDGKLWHWDIFNHYIHTQQEHYAKPLTPDAPVIQGFSICIDGKWRRLDSRGFTDISFLGQYPIATITYQDAGISVQMEAFSPYIPLNVDDSSLPATVFHFTLTNSSASPTEIELAGYLQNAVCLRSFVPGDGKRVNTSARIASAQAVNFALTPLPKEPPAEVRPLIVFEDFEGPDYGKWTTTGTAFGNGPARGAPSPEQHLSGYQGHGLANSWQRSDGPQGTLTSPAFVINRRYINFLIGGGQHPDQTCIDLLVDSNRTHTATGKNSDAMEWHTWDVSALEGKSATIKIVDQSSGAWGHIDIDQIEFSDEPRAQDVTVDQREDFGTMSLALLDTVDSDSVIPNASVDEQTGQVKPGDDLLGAVSRKLKLAAGESRTITFALAWCFPNLKLPNVIGGQGRWYANRFKTAGDCIAYLSTDFDRLHRLTKLWRDNWYDSSLPFWFLNRTHLNTSILATSTAYRFANGRFYGWEGVGSCPGTCTHVWEYEQAMGRLFPQLDILLRERADFDPKISFHPDGMIDHRGEFHAGHAVDGQAGIILRSLRDHQTSPDDSFLKRNWTSIKKATQWLIGQDANKDGILTGAQHNTLDAEWYGPVAWLSGMYLAALHAAEAMAIEVGDNDFAAQCRNIYEAGEKNFVARLFNGEYFINLPDPKRKDSINSGSGCEIDQVLGQSWAWQVGLGRVLPAEQTQSALKSLWKYNFAPDVGPYRAANKPGRWYAMPGEAGLLMCTFPRPDWSYHQAEGKGPDWAAGYFNECMNGFEHQAAGHMIWEGLITEGLAVERALHDRYHPSRRNPYNEVECGDHYARSMASYGVFIAACGFEYHGPKGRIGFAPRLSPENFKAAFTGAQGWGSYTQVIASGKLSATLAVLHGQLSLQEISFAQPATRCDVTGPTGAIAATLSTSDQKTIVRLPDRLILHEGDKVEIAIS
jgi:uncharacterized protein (DUF608 family)